MALYLLFSFINFSLFLLVNTEPFHPNPSALLQLFPSSLPLKSVWTWFLTNYHLLPALLSRGLLCSLITLFLVHWFCSPIITRCSITQPLPHFSSLAIIRVSNIRLLTFYFLDSLVFTYYFASSPPILSSHDKQMFYNSTASCFLTSLLLQSSGLVIFTC